MFRDIGSEALFVHTRHEQVGAFRERCQHRALVHPDLRHPFHDLGQRAVGVLHVADEKIRRRVQLRVGVGSIGDRISPTDSANATMLGGTAMRTS